MSKSNPVSDCAEAKRIQSVLIVDDESSGPSLVRWLTRHALTVALVTDFDQARERVAAACPDLLICELKIGVNWSFDLLKDLRAEYPQMKLAILTSYPSVATAARAVRLGIDVYLPKTGDPSQLLRAVGIDATSVDQTPQANWPTLDRTIWEYLNQVYVAAGSLSEAARVLRVDRRSLRRMLKKFPPAR